MKEKKKFKDLKIVKTIKKSDFSSRRKKGILRRLKRIFNSEKERARCGFQDDKKIDAAFIWCDTKDGWAYWQRVCKFLG